MMAHVKIPHCPPPSSSGPGRSPLKAKTGVRFPLGVLFFKTLMEKDIFSILDELSIQFERIDHVPVYTSEQARKLMPHNAAASAKNLFLRDKKGRRHFLLIVDDMKIVDFKSLARQIPSTQLSIASPVRLTKYLQINPGAVSLLALINDPQGEVQLLVDRSLWDNNAIQLHPLVNTSTLVIQMTYVNKFLDFTHHEPHFVDLD